MKYEASGKDTLFFFQNTELFLIVSQKIIIIPPDWHKENDPYYLCVFAGVVLLCMGIGIRINDAPCRCHKCDLAQVIPVDRTDRPSVPETGPSHAERRGKA